MDLLLRSRGEEIRRLDEEISVLKEENQRLREDNRRLKEVDPVKVLLYFVFYDLLSRNKNIRGASLFL